MGQEPEARSVMKPLSVGQRMAFTKTLTEADVVLFAGITGDFYPLHINEEFARKTRLGSRLVHGALTASLISTALSMLQGSPRSDVKTCLYRSLETKFTAPVRIGDTITAEVEVVEIVDDRNIAVIEARCVNQRGETVVTGTATLKMVEV